MPKKKIANSTASSERAGELLDIVVEERSVFLFRAEQWFIGGILSDGTRQSNVGQLSIVADNNGLCYAVGGIKPKYAIADFSKLTDQLFDVMKRLHHLQGSLDFYTADGSIHEVWEW